MRITLPTFKPRECISLNPDAKIHATAYVSSYNSAEDGRDISSAFDSNAETFWLNCWHPMRYYKGIQCSLPEDSQKSPSKVLIRFDEPQEIRNFLLKKHSDIDISQKDYNNVCVSVPDPKMVGQLFI